MRPALAKFVKRCAADHPRCKTCSDHNLSADVVEFLDAKARGELPELSFQRFYDRHVLGTYPAAASFTPFRIHVLRCLRRDPVTGRTL